MSGAQYSQAAIKAMQNYKKRQSVDAIDAPMPSIPQRPVRPQAPPIQAPVAPPTLPATNVEIRLEQNRWALQTCGSQARAAEVTLRHLVKEAAFLAQARQEDAGLLTVSSASRGAI